MGGLPLNRRLDPNLEILCSISLAGISAASNTAPQLDKGKPTERRGRKATGLRAKATTAGLPAKATGPG